MSEASISVWRVTKWVCCGVVIASVLGCLALAIARSALGTLDRVKRIVRVVGYVASADGFVEQPAVVNGASDFLVKLFDEAGKHARLAVGAVELPLNAPVELEMIVHTS